MSDGISTLPQWWSAQIAAAWDRSRDAAISDWSIRGDRFSAVDATIIEHALAFGHGARSAYSEYVTWDAAAPQLRADWIQLGNVGPAAWDRVAPIIEHEWQRAGGPGGDASPDVLQQHA